MATKLTDILEAMDWDESGRGVTVAIHELSTSDKVVEWVKPLGVEVIKTNDRSSHSRKRRFRGNAELIIDAHAYWSAAVVRAVLPEARIILTYASSEGVTKAREEKPDVATFSVTGMHFPEYNLGRYSKEAFIAFAAGNDGDEGENKVNKYDDFVSTIGGVDAGSIHAFYDKVAGFTLPLEMAKYSSFGKGYVDFSMFTEFDLPCGEFYNGTSAATPLFAALVAGMGAKFYKKTGARPSVRTFLDIARKGAIDILDFGKDLKSGYGLFWPAKELEVNTLTFTAISAKVEDMVEHKEKGSYERNGREKTIDTYGIVTQDDRTLLPARVIAEEMGGSVTWSPSEELGKINVRIAWLK